MNLEIPDFGFKGIKKIEIPKNDFDFRDSEDFGFSIIKKYLPTIIKCHQENAKKINFLHNYYLGLQDIVNKKRIYAKDNENNNIMVENHALRQVDFKIAFTTGEKRDYTPKPDVKTDDLIYLDRYFTDCDFWGKDSTLKEWIYTTGIGVTRIVPRTDIIIEDYNSRTNKKTFRYATKEDGFDIRYDSPFEFDVLNPAENFVVYSSSANKQPLFCISIVNVDVSKPSDNEPDIQKEIQVETRYATFLIKSDNVFNNYDWANGISNIKPKALKYLSLIEHCSKDARISLVEVNRDAFNMINTLKSNITDMIVDNANAILVFKNTDITAEQVQEMKKAGAIIISDNNYTNSNSHADLSTITIEIPFDGLNTFIEGITRSSYDIAGVPLGSGQVTSGGDTGQSRLLGGGWTNALSIAKLDIRSFLSSDYKVLKDILLICNSIPNSPVNDLHSSQIDIKYRLNQTDNFLVKAQGIMNLYGSNMPLEEILKASGLFNDVTTVAKKWEERDEKIRSSSEEVIDVETNKAPIDNKLKGLSKGNNSKE